MAFCTKIFVGISQESELIPMWFDGTIRANWWFIDRPQSQGIWVWEENKGWRHPTNQEWGKIFKNGTPLEASNETVDLDEWIKKASGKE